MKLNLLILLLLVVGCVPNKKSEVQSTNNKKYVFFLHNKFAEENDLNVAHPQYGKVEYSKILETFQKDGCLIISEKRKPNTEVKKYAKKVVQQIDSLLVMGIQANHISVIGTSKGGYIAQYVSTYAANPDINYVFIGCFQEDDIQNHPDIQFCGNILTIYEQSDPFGVSAIQRKKTSKLKINQFKEIELNTNLNHGFLYQANSKWLEPCLMWVNRNYDLKN
jgi:hypothetical protein